jgi:branched-chain amino acid transport system ATP-binding protein
MLEVDGLSAGYRTGTVLAGVSLTVAEGEVLALLGRNGMGKSTMLRAIAGLRPPAVTGGSVRVAGAEVSTLAAYQVARRGVSLVPQGRRVFGSLTVEENLRVVARPGDWDAARVYELFPRLAERRTQAAATLSGGEQQMLAIGRALMSDPRLLLLDEPSLGLAPQLIGRIARIITEIHQQGTAVVLVEQNATMALQVADHAAVLEVGRIALAGPAAELAASDDVQQLYLGGHAGSRAQAESEAADARAQRRTRTLSRWVG